MSDVLHEKEDLDVTLTSISRILDNIDALVYVSDMETYELIYMNKYGRDIWGDPNGRLCWQVLQSGQTKPCDFCTNNRLIDADGMPTGAYVWEFQNTVDDHWYQCRDQAISWLDGRLVRLEIASDITERKNMEEELKASKSKYEKLARTDELTGIINRRGFFEEGNKLCNLAKRFNHPTSIIMLDIDYFKQVNDDYGHSVGDKALIQFVETIHKNIREVDVFARLGGEEFAIVLPETDKNGAVKIAEKLCAKISAMIITHDVSPLSITCSFGVTTFRCVTTSFEEALSNADKALYQAKSEGRNRVIVHDAAKDETHEIKS